MEYALSQRAELSVLLERLKGLSAQVVCQAALAIPPVAVNVEPPGTDLSGIETQMEELKNHMKTWNWGDLAGKLDGITDQMSRRDGYDYAMLAATFLSTGIDLKGILRTLQKQTGDEIGNIFLQSADVLKSASKLGNSANSPATGGAAGIPSTMETLGTGGNALMELVTQLGSGMSGLGKKVTEMFTKWDLGAKLAAAGTQALQLGMTVLSSPITWILVAIAALAALIIANWDTIREVLLEAWEFIQEQGAALWEGLTTFLSDMWQGFLTFLTTLQQTVITVIQGMLGFLQLIFVAIPQWIWDNVLAPAIQGITQWVGGIMECVSGFLSGAASALGAVPGWIKAHILDPIINHFKSTVNFLIGLVEGFANMGIRAVNTLIKALNKIHFDIPEWVPGIGGKSFGISIPTIPQLSLPRLAQGAVIPPSSQFLAILGDQTAGRNLEAPEGLIRQILREELASGTKHTQPIQVEVYLDGKQITAAVEHCQRQRGATFIRGGYSYGY